MSEVPDATTVKLLGVVLIAIFGSEQISTLFESKLEKLFEIKGFPSIKQVQEGREEFIKLPITDTLVPRKRIKPSIKRI